MSLISAVDLDKLKLIIKLNFHDMLENFGCTLNLCQLIKKHIDSAHLYGLEMVKLNDMDEEYKPTVCECNDIYFSELAYSIKQIPQLYRQQVAMVLLPEEIFNITICKSAKSSIDELLEQLPFAEIFIKHDINTLYDHIYVE